ncbi:MAG: sigma-70 family RNA polymerase sigma factor [Gemmataceae bacterium]|nr:sigma-70 family RNA polymerase sigma factor [Gemmataceae bacterium]
MASDQTVYLEGCLARLRAGDAAARDELVAAAAGRLTDLASVMLRGYGRLRRWEQTDDVMQGALVRLSGALGRAAPESARHFHRLAVQLIRRELIDLARRYFGPEGHGRHTDSVPPPGDGGDAAGPPEPETGSLDPGRLAAWTDFHRQAEALPDDEREVFELVWYQGLKQVNAAALLGVSDRTVLRRWQAACLKLHDALQGIVPR